MALYSSALSFTGNDSTLLYLKFTEGKCVGCHQGYTTAGLYHNLGNLTRYPLMPFVDLRLHYQNSGDCAANIGTGIRTYISEYNGILGFNFYYDMRHLYDHHHHQWGLGSEWLGSVFDIHFNAYVPFGPKKIISFDERVTFPGGYWIHYMSEHVLLTGGDVEIISSLSRFMDLGYWDFFLALGPYYYRNHHQDLIGGRWRLGMQYGYHIAIELRNYVDSECPGKIQGVLKINWPFSKNRCRHVDPIVYRQEMIAITPHCCFWETNY